MPDSQVEVYNKYRPGPGSCSGKAGCGAGREGGGGTGGWTRLLWVFLWQCLSWLLWGVRTKQSASILPQKFFAIEALGSAITRGRTRSIVANMDSAATVSFYMFPDNEINNSWGPDKELTEDRSPECMAFLLTAYTIFMIGSKHQTSSQCVVLLWSSAAIVWMKATSQHAFGHLTLQQFVKPTITI